MNYRFLPLLTLLSMDLSLAGVHPVFPSGRDDTGAVQAALNVCVTDNDCVVQLQPGLYRTSQIVINGFRGSIRGAGRGTTIVEPFGILSAAGFDHTKPPSFGNPYPSLWSFVDGSIRVSGISFRVVAENPVEPYKTTLTSWNTLDPAFGPNTPAWPQPDPSTHLLSLLLVTGTRADLEILHCDFSGAKGTFTEVNIAPASDSFNLHAAVVFWGIHPNRLDGGLRVQSSVFRDMMAGIVAFHLSNRQVTIGGGLAEGNEFDRACYAIEMDGLSGNAVDISHNVVSQGCQYFTRLFWIEQAARDLNPAPIRIARNRFFLNDGAAITIADYVRAGVDSASAHFAITANHIVSRRNAAGIHLFSVFGPRPAGSFSSVDALVANNLMEGDSTRVFMTVSGGANATIVANDISGYKTTRAPYLLNNAWSCLLSGSSGTVEILGNDGTTHTLLGGLQRSN